MLRKDVKLGFAIGGVMLAVVVVYVLVVPNNERKGAQLVTEVSPTNNSTGGDSTAKPDQTASDNKPTDVKPADAKPTDAKPTDPDNKPDNVGEPRTDVAISGSGQPTTAPSAAAAGNKGDVWDIALREGKIPPSMSTTPSSNDAVNTSGNTPAPADQSAARSDASSDKTVADQATDKTPDKTPDKQAMLLSNQPDAAVADPGAGDVPADAKLASDTQPKPAAGANGKSYVVKPGETLSSIAASNYGDARAWKQIAAANPTINPNRLSAGTHIVLPTATTPTHTSGVGSATTLDAKSQYQVQANDSLYRISMRLYGKADHVEKLYEDNKDVIGADPRHLKLGMVLKLTDPPAASVSAAR